MSARTWCHCGDYADHLFPIIKCQGCGDSHLPYHWGDMWCDDCKALPRAGLTNWEIKFNEGGPRERKRKDGTIERYELSPSITSSMAPRYWSPVRFAQRHYMPVIFFPSVEARDQALTALRGE
jgi:hypothetical protein